MQVFHCPKCEGKMERGFPLDVGNSGVCQARWAPGEPEKSMWTGLKLDKSKLLSIVTLRCTRCGFLEQYAPSA